MRGTTNTRESIIARLTRKGADECWPWEESLNRGGYGRVRYQKKVWLAHRLFYEFFVGPIPKGAHLDHICHSRPDSECLLVNDCPHRRCVNPAHLDPVQPGPHSQRNKRHGPVRDSKTHCVNNHEFTPENSYYTPAGQRSCRQCTTAAKRRFRERRKNAPL